MNLNIIYLFLYIIGSISLIISVLYSNWDINFKYNKLKLPTIYKYQIFFMSIIGFSVVAGLQNINNIAFKYQIILGFFGSIISSIISIILLKEAFKIKTKKYLKLSDFNDLTGEVLYYSKTTNFYKIKVKTIFGDLIFDGKEIEDRHLKPLSKVKIIEKNNLLLTISKEYK